MTESVSSRGVCVHACVCVWDRACTDLNDMWHVRQSVHVFTLRSVCVCACSRKKRALVCLSVATHSDTLTYLCPPGDDAKNMWLLKPSGVWAASVCSLLHRRPCGPPSPIVRYSHSLHSSLNYNPLPKHGTVARTHTQTTPSCVPAALPARMTSAPPRLDGGKQKKKKKRLTRE